MSVLERPCLLQPHACFVFRRLEHASYDDAATYPLNRAQTALIHCMCLYKLLYADIKQLRERIGVVLGLMTAQVEPAHEPPPITGKARPQVDYRAKICYTRGSGMAERRAAWSRVWLTRDPPHAYALNCCRGRDGAIRGVMVWLWSWHVIERTCPYMWRTVHCEGT